MARVLALATVALVSFSWWIKAWRPWRLVVVVVVVVAVAVVVITLQLWEDALGYHNGDA